MEPITTLAAVAFAALIAGPSDTPQGPQWLTCATIDKGGYFVFADPTCPEMEQDGLGEEKRQAAEAAARQAAGL